MSYDKYIKYKTKYLQLKAKHVQQGGAGIWVIADGTTPITPEESKLLDKRKILGQEVVIGSKNLSPGYMYSYVINADGVTGSRTSMKDGVKTAYKMTYKSDPDDWAKFFQPALLPRSSSSLHAQPPPLPVYLPSPSSAPLPPSPPPIYAPPPVYLPPPIYPPPPAYPPSPALTAARQLWQQAPTSALRLPPPSSSLHAPPPPSPPPSGSFQTDNKSLVHAINDIKEFQKVHGIKPIWLKQGRIFINIDDISVTTAEPQIAYLEIVNPNKCIHHIGPKRRMVYEEDVFSGLISTTIEEGHPKKQVVYTEPEFIRDAKRNIDIKRNAGFQVNIDYLRKEYNIDYLNKFKTDMPESIFEQIIRGYTKVGKGVGAYI